MIPRDLSSYPHHEFLIAHTDIIDVKYSRYKFPRGTSNRQIIDVRYSRYTLPKGTSNRHIIHALPVVI